MTLVIYIIVAFVNVVLHILRSILVIKSGKLLASFANCVCYTFSAVVIKFIAEVDLMTAIIVQAATNFLGCWVGMNLGDLITEENGVQRFNSKNNT